MDRVLVEGIEFHGFHGVAEAEREVGHRFRVDLAMELDLRPAGEADDVTLTVDYGAAASMVAVIGEGESVRLVETLAERMAAELLDRFPLLDAVTVRVTKIHPPVRLCFGSSAVEIRRTRV